MCRVDQLFSILHEDSFLYFRWYPLITAHSEHAALAMQGFFILFSKTVADQHNGGEIKLLLKDDHPPALQNDNNLVCLALFCNLTQLLCIVSA